MKKIIILGHRGFSKKYPENTILSFSKAIEAGADGIELDVRLTKDNVPVVFHDEDLSRLFGIKKKIRDMNLRDLKKLRFPMNQEIPTFKEVLERIPRDIFINVEIKDVEATEKIIELLSNRKKSNTLISSFHLEALKIVDEISDFRYALLEEKPDEKVYKLDFYSINLAIDFFKEYKNVLDEIDKNIVFWSFDDEKFYKSRDWIKFAWMVMTNDIERMIEFVARPGDGISSFSIPLV